MDEQLELFDSRGRGTFGTLFNFEADTIAFRNALKTLTFDGTIVNKDIFAAIVYRDESETL